MVLTFLYISPRNPHFDLEPDYVIRNQESNVSNDILLEQKLLSKFHARVECISVKIVISGK